MTERNESPLKYPKEFHTLVQITGMLLAVLVFTETRIEEIRRMNNINHLEFWELIEAQPNK